MRRQQIPEYSNSQIRELIDEWVHDEIDAEMLYLRLAKGVCYEPLAEKFGVSVSTVKHRLEKWQRVIFKHL